MNVSNADAESASSVRVFGRLAVGGALLFPLLLVVVAAIQWDFLHERGWRLFDHGNVTWPSGTALGPWGFLQVLNFLVLGVSLLSLAVVLRRFVRVRRNVGPWLVGLMGIALLLSAFRIDEPMAFAGEGGSPETWNGVLHGIGFGLLLITSLLSTIVLGFQLRRDPRWSDLGRVSFAAAIGLPLALFGIGTLNGAIGFYLFLAILLAWIVTLALRGNRLASVPKSFGTAI